MSTSYDQIAGHSVERLAALSDGVFAIVMTLLVLDLRALAMESIHGEQDLWHALIGLALRLCIYMMTFLTWASSWVGQQTHLSHKARAMPTTGERTTRVSFIGTRVLPQKPERGWR